MQVGRCTAINNRCEHREDKPMRVLVIEDEEPLRGLIEGIALSATPPGSAAVGCGTLAEGLEAMDRERFDLILLDIHLPDSPNIDTYDSVAMRAENVETPILVVTGHAHGELLADLSIRGAVIMTKPFYRNDLSAMIRCLTCRHRPQMQDIFTQFRRGFAQIADTFQAHAARSPA